MEQTQSMKQPKSVVADGMQIDWDVPIKMDDGLVLRADVFRPNERGKFPVIMTYGPYAKGLSFQEGYSSSWNIMVAGHPDIPYGSYEQVSELGSRRSREMGSRWLRHSPGRFTRLRPLAWLR